MIELRVGLAYRFGTHDAGSVRPIHITKVTATRVSFRDPPDSPKVQWDGRYSGFNIRYSELEAWQAVLDYHKRQLAHYERKIAETREHIAMVEAKMIFVPAED